MSEFALTGNEFCQAAAEAAAGAFQMDEERFRAFYERTARRLWSYLCRVTGDPAVADDLVQETYYRFLRAQLPEMSEAQWKSYLFRIASNLLHDNWRKLKREPTLISDRAEAIEAAGPPARTAEQVEHRSEPARAFGRLKPRERELLWLA